VTKKAIAGRAGTSLSEREAIMGINIEKIPRQETKIREEGPEITEMRAVEAISVLLTKECGEIIIGMLLASEKDALSYGSCAGKALVEATSRYHECHGDHVSSSNLHNQVGKYPLKTTHNW